MQLENIHYDRSYNHFLLLQLSYRDEGKVRHTALLYDHPTRTNSCKFLGHLIKQFDDLDTSIESIMTIDSLLVIVSRTDNNNTLIKEYRITEFYSVYETRTYPLYGRKIVHGGSHTSDGHFLYIEVEL